MAIKLVGVGGRAHLVNAKPTLALKTEVRDE